MWTSWISFSFFQTEQSWAGTTAIGAQLQSFTSTFMLIFSSPLTLCSNFAMLAHVARLAAVVTAHWFQNKQAYLHLEVPNHDLLWHFWYTEGQKQSVGGDLLNIPFHCHSVHFNNTLFLQFVPDLPFRHAGQLMTADDSMGWVQCLMNIDLHWSIHKSCRFMTHCLHFFAAFNLKRSVPQSVNTLQGPAYCLKSVLNNKRRQFAQW